MTLGRHYPAGGSTYEEGTVAIRCQRGHLLEVAGFDELGYSGPAEPLTPCRACRRYLERKRAQQGGQHD